MTMSPITRIWISAGGSFVVLAASLFIIATISIPHLAAHRETIRTNEASIAAIQRQQDNLSGLTRQLKERTLEQERLNLEMWSFSSEDSFFDRWASLGQTTNTAITLDSVADAAPGPIPVRREATLTLTGSIPSILATLDAIAAIKPAVVPQSLDVRAGETAATTTAQLIVSTLWYDDTLQ